MDEKVARTIRNISTLNDLAQFESNAQQRDALTDEIKDAIRVRSGELGRALITERTGLALTDLSPAEEKIVQAVSEYVGVMKRQGKDATRTLLQLRNRGLIDAAETAVAKSKPTQGFQTLADADLTDLSYEQIVLDHPDEFSPRAIWFSRRTLGMPNDSHKPPAKALNPAPVCSLPARRAGGDGGRRTPDSKLRNFRLLWPRVASIPARSVPRFCTSLHSALPNMTQNLLPA
jgi:hypothetical protein